MTIIINKEKSDERRYSESELKKMNKTEIKQLRAQLQLAQEEIALRKSQYQNNNTEAKNSKTYWEKINNYKQAISIIRRELLYLSNLAKSSEIAPEPDREKEQHWLWCFYQESIKKVNKRTLSKISESADSRAGYHVELEVIPRKEA